VVDLIAPFPLEVAEVGERGAERRALVRWRTRQLIAHVAAADVVLCTNPNQRDLLVGAALAADLDEAVRRDGHILVVPHGIDAEPPPRGRSALRTAELSDDRLRVAIWAGGMWSWLDPLTAIKAVESLKEARPDLRLAFVGFEHPDPRQRRAHQPLESHARSYVRDRELEHLVVFRSGWLTREDYMHQIADADVGLSLHGPTLEARFASRTRIGDYLSARLPVVCSEGDAMSAFVGERELGSVVPPLDVEACALAMARLTRAGSLRIDDHVLEPLLWRNVARPLLEYCLDPGPAPHRSPRAPFTVAARQYPAFMRALYRTDGAGAIVRKAAERAGRLLA
jgi:glycosyltransferase involved in cell wall biosynthesis